MGSGTVLLLHNRRKSSRTVSNEEGNSRVNDTLMVLNYTTKRYSHGVYANSEHYINVNNK